VRLPSETARRCLAPALLAAAVALSACGSSSKTSSQTSASGSSTNGSAATTKQPAPQSSGAIARDRALGAAGLLRASDFASGWVATPRAKKTGHQPRLQDEAAKCLHVSISQLGEHEPQEVESPKFRGPSGESASNSVTVRPTAAAAAKSFAVLENPRTPSCLTSIFGKLLGGELQRRAAKGKLPPGFSIGHPVVERLQFAPVADQSVAYRFSIPINTPALKVKAYLDVIAVRAGRADTSFSFDGTIKPVAAGAESQLINAAIRRLQAAGAGVAGKTSSA